MTSNEKHTLVDAHKSHVRGKLDAARDQILEIRDVSSGSVTTLSSSLEKVTFYNFTNFGPDFIWITFDGQTPQFNTGVSGSDFNIQTFLAPGQSYEFFETEDIAATNIKMIVTGSRARVVLRVGRTDD